MATPTLTDVKAYLGTDHTWTDADIAGALAAETAAQGRACKVPSDMPSDLAEALKRRVARNLAARAVTLATVTSFEGGSTSVRVTRVDGEVARLEGPFRRRTVG